MPCLSVCLLFLWWKIISGHRACLSQCSPRQVQPTHFSSSFSCGKHRAWSLPLWFLTGTQGSLPSSSPGQLRTRQCKQAFSLLLFFCCFPDRSPAPCVRLLVGQKFLSSYQIDNCGWVPLIQFILIEFPAEAQPAMNGYYLTLCNYCPWCIQMCWVCFTVECVSCHNMVKWKVSWV